MNRERAKELLPIIQAFAEGKEIQLKSEINGKWIAAFDDPQFQMGGKWRVKPEPREWYIALHDARPPSVHEIDTTDLIAGIKIVHVKEVLEDE